MKVKIIIVSFFLLYIISTSFSQNYLKGDFLFVVDKLGLKVRSGPDRNTEMIGLLVYGDTVRIENVDQSLTDTISELPGHWVFISSERLKIQGYVFDGFISQYPVKKIMKILERYENYQGEHLEWIFPELFKEYAFFAFGETACSFDFSEGDEVDYSSMHLEQLGHGAKWIERSNYQRVSYELQLVSPRVSEIYYLIKNLIDLVPGSKIYLDRIQQKFWSENGDSMPCVASYKEYDCVAGVDKCEGGKSVLFLHFNH